MTKVINIRLTIAADDGVTTEAFIAHLEGKLSSMATEHLGKDGTRVHWATASAVRVVERPGRPPTLARKRSAAVAAPAEPAELPV